MKIGLVGNISKPRLPEVMREFIALLERGQVSYTCDTETAGVLGIEGDESKVLPISRLGEACDLVVAFGGDGTILSTASQVGCTGVPILGVNLGGLGFLAEVLIDELDRTVNDLLAGRFKIIERMVLNVRIVKNGEERSFSALNDLVVDKGALPRLKLFNIRINNTFLNTYRSDGVIIATPTGSTAYSLSAGGPLVVPTLHGIIVTPICPHSLTVRPIVLSDESVLELSIPPGQTPAQVSIDGKSRPDLDAGDDIIIRKADHVLRWISIGKRDFFEILRTKLNWGVDHPKQPRPEV